MKTEKVQRTAYRTGMKVSDFARSKQTYRHLATGEVKSILVERMGRRVKRQSLLDWRSTKLAKLQKARLVC